MGQCTQYVNVKCTFSSETMLLCLVFQYVPSPATWQALHLRALKSRRFWDGTEQVVWWSNRGSHRIQIFVQTQNEGREWNIHLKNWLNMNIIKIHQQNASPARSHFLKHVHIYDVVPHIHANNIRIFPTPSGSSLAPLLHVCVYYNWNVSLLSKCITVGEFTF